MIALARRRCSRPDGRRRGRCAAPARVVRRAALRAAGDRRAPDRAGRSPGRSSSAAAAGLIAPMLAPGQIDGADVMRMHNPRYVGQTGDAEPFEVTAASASMDPAQAQPDPSRSAGRRTSRPRGTRRASACWRLPGIYDRASEDAGPGRRHRGHDQRRLSLRDAERHGQSGARAGWSGGEPIAGAGPSGTLAAERFEFQRRRRRAALRGPRQGYVCNPRSDVRS